MTAATEEAPAVPPDSGIPSRRSVPPAFIDALAVAALTGIGLLGFQASFGGWAFLVTGMAGATLGIALAWFAWRLRALLVTMAAAALVVVVALGGLIALRATVVAGVLPTSETLRGLAQGFTKGWVDLATTPPPAGDVGNLLAIPYLCGFISGISAMSIAERSRRHRWAVIPPALVLAAGIFTGTIDPVSLVVQGAGFALVAIAWSAWRSSRSRLVVSGAADRSRLLSAGVLLALAGLGGLLLAPHLPGADANERQLLRTYAEPRLDVSRYPSPLTGVRKYLMTKEQRDRVMFTVSGLPSKDTPIRLAVMDTWDGTAMGVAGSTGSQSSGEFRRVGTQIPTTVKGTASAVQIEIKGYNDYWIPTVGGTAGVSLGGTRADDLKQTFFYNTATDSALTTAGLTEGDRIALSSVVPAAVGDLGTRRAAAIDQPQPTAKVPDKVVELGGTLVREASSPYDLVQSIAEGLSNGFYTPHDQDPETDQPPGHGAARLISFAGADSLIGDEEQYGAVATLVARSAQVPVRLVLGFRDNSPTNPWNPSAPIDVRGENLDTWLEVALEGAGWVPVTGITPDRTNLPTNTEKPQPKPRPEVQVPPKPQVKEQKQQAANDEDAGKDAEEPDAGFQLPGWVGRVVLGVGLPLLILGMYVGAILALKRRRRKRRRSNPDPGSAVAGGWQEVIDGARDLGLPMASSASTRREIGRHLVHQAEIADPVLIHEMAARADAAVFAPIAPSAAEVEAYWNDVETARRGWASGHGRMRRLRSRISLRSLRGHKRPNAGGRSPKRRKP